MRTKTALWRCTAPLCLEKAHALLLVLQPTGPDLVLMPTLEVLLWTA